MVRYPCTPGNLAFVFSRPCLIACHETYLQYAPSTSFLSVRRQPFPQFTTGVNIETCSGFPVPVPQTPELAASLATSPLIPRSLASAVSWSSRKESAPQEPQNAISQYIVASPSKTHQTRDLQLPSPCDPGGSQRWRRKTGFFEVRRKPSASPIQLHGFFRQRRHSHRDRDASSKATGEW
jgi:hypothetical protein